MLWLKGVVHRFTKITHMKFLFTVLFVLVSVYSFAQEGFSEKDSIELVAQKEIIILKGNCCSGSIPFKMGVITKDGVLVWFDGFVKMKENLRKLVPTENMKSKYEKKFGTSETISHINGVVLKKQGWADSPEYVVKFNRTNFEEDARTFLSFKNQEDAEVVYQALVKIVAIVLGK